MLKLLAGAFEPSSYIWASHCVTFESPWDVWTSPKGLSNAPSTNGVKRCRPIDFEREKKIQSNQLVCQTNLLVMKKSNHTKLSLIKISLARYRWLIGWMQVNLGLKSNLFEN